MKTSKQFLINCILLAVLFVMNASSCQKDEENNISDSLKDADGNVYKTIVIGNLEWMAENLRTTKYVDGTPIISGLNYEEWGRTQVGAYAIYPHDGFDGTVSPPAAVEGVNSQKEMVNAYGKLYNWFAVTNEKGLCPKGWRIPTNEDWKDFVSITGGMTQSGKELKSARTALGGDGETVGIPTNEHPRWDFAISDSHGSDSYGFAALPAGARQAVNPPAGSNYEYYSLHRNVGTWATFWTSTESSAFNAHAWSISHSNTRIYNQEHSKKNGHSIRCVRNK
jgi:uncharacterized protein (TIGR02145 family)